MAAELKGSLVVYGLLAVTAGMRVRHRIYLSIALGLLFLLTYQWELACFMSGLTLAAMDLEEITLIPNHSHSLSIPKRSQNTLHHTTFLLAWYILGQPHGTLDPEISYNTPGWYYLTQTLTPPIYYNNEFWRFWNVIGATLLIYAIFRINWVQRFLSRPTLRYMGQISFAFYLIHIPIAWTIGDRVARVLGVRRPDVDTVWDGLFVVPDFGLVGFSAGLICWQAVVLPLNVVLAAVVTRRFDEPSVRFSRFVAERVGLGG
ncbi:hypothetical protein PMZ80_011037 [Knufia obscura]|nr:hypothetical protein PMZ80_011037 [Knufia obscura]